MNALPLVEVFSDPFVDHVLEDVTTATAARSDGLLRLLLDLFADGLDRRLGEVVDRFDFLVVGTYDEDIEDEIRDAFRVFDREGNGITMNIPSFQSS